MRIIFDGRVIQDHFPGIGRYAYNLLHALPAQLSADDDVLAWRDPHAINTRFDWQPLLDLGIRVADTSIPLFGLTNVLRPPAVPTPAAGSAIVHYPYYMRPWRVNLPTVTTIHDVISLAVPQLLPSARTRIAIRLMHWLVIRASRAIITVSQSAANDIAQYYPSARGKLHVVYEAADAGFTPQSAERIASVRQQYTLPEHFAFFLASNKPHKNLVRLVEAWHILPVHCAHTLIIAGHQDARYNEAQMRASELGMHARVRFVGDIPNADLPAFYSACDLFVYPSLYEGFGLPPLEAMACGAPVACSNASSLPEVVADAGLLFDPLRAEDIAAAVQRVLSDAGLQRAMSALSLARASRFTWENTAHATMQIYRDAAAQVKQA